MDVSKLSRLPYSPENAQLLKEEIEKQTHKPVILDFNGDKSVSKVEFERAQKIIESSQRRILGIDFGIDDSILQKQLEQEIEMQSFVAKPDKAANELIKSFNTNQKGIPVFFKDGLTFDTVINDNNKRAYQLFNLAKKAQESLTSSKKDKITIEKEGETIAINTKDLITALPKLIDINTKEGIDNLIKFIHNLQGKYKINENDINKGIKSSKNPARVYNNENGYIEEKTIIALKDIINNCK